MPSSGCKKCARSEEHTSELQSHDNLVCRLLLEKNKFTAALLSRLTSPGLAIEMMFPSVGGAGLEVVCVFLRVAADVARGPGGGHVFFLNIPPPPEFYFFPPHPLSRD